MADRDESLPDFAALLRELLGPDAQLPPEMEQFLAAMQGGGDAYHGGDGPLYVSKASSKNGDSTYVAARTSAGRLSGRPSACQRTRSASSSAGCADTSPTSVANACSAPP